MKNNIYAFLLGLITLGGEFLFIRLNTGIYGEALLHPLLLSLAVFGTSLGALLFQWKKLSKFFDFEKYALLIFCTTFIFILNTYGFFTFLPLGPHIGLVLFLSTILFLTFGFIIAKLLSSESKKRLQIYFFDLLGGTTGISAFFIISNLFSISYSLIFFEVIIIFLFIAYAHYQRLSKVLLTSLLILGCIPLIGNQENPKTLCRYYQEVQQLKFEFKPYQTFSNSFSKIHLMKINPQHFTRVEQPPLETEQVRAINKSVAAVIDCTGCSFGFTTYNNKELAIYDDQLSSMPFLLFKPSKIAMIGTGLGMDVRRALHFGVSKIDATEINPLFKKISDDFYKEESIYNHPNVSLSIDDGRRRISQSSSTYDLIFIQFTKYFGSYGSTHFPVGINPLYTKEAFKIYFDHIAPNGFIYLYDIGMFTKTFFFTWSDLFKELNLNPKEHMMGFMDKPFAGLLISKAPLSQETRQMIRNFSKLPPFKPQKSEYHRNVLEDDYPTIYGASSLLGNWRNSEDKVFNETSVFFFLVSIILLFFISFLIKKLLKKNNNEIHSTISFTLIGLGFAFAELSFLYKATWALASPSWGVCWIFINIFIASSIGAFISNYINFSQTRKWLLISSSSAALLFLLGYLFDSQMFPFLYVQSDLLRFSSIFTFIWASFGLTGLTFAILLKNIQIKSVASMYALNGTAILVGSLLTIPIHISFGFKIGFLIASILYGLVAIMVLKFKQALPTDIKE